MTAQRSLPTPTILNSKLILKVCCLCAAECIPGHPRMQPVPQGKIHPRQNLPAAGRPACAAGARALSSVLFPQGSAGLAAP